MGHQRQPQWILGGGQWLLEHHQQVFLVASVAAVILSLSTKYKTTVALSLFVVALKLSCSKFSSLAPLCVRVSVFVCGFFRVGTRISFYFHLSVLPPVFIS